MGKKIFVSYKYSDSRVQNLPGNYWTTARHYVDVLQNRLKDEDHINKGENDGEDLSNFKDSTIESKLRNKIFDSSITIVMISKGMNDNTKQETDHWIPWEVSYSLRESTRNGITSQTNAILAVVLPDENGSYNYMMEYNSTCDSTTYNRWWLFRILRENMFNVKQSETRVCNGTTIYNGLFSYMHCVRWEHFIDNIDTYLTIALSIKENADDYIIKKNVD